MNWETLKKSIYFEDGSFRDILIPEFSRTDWKRWVDLVNSKYKVEFSNHQTNSITNQIDYGVVEDYWEGNSEVISATIYLDQVIVKCYFFDEEEFENDIDPVEFKSIHDDSNLMNYLKDISSNLDRTIYLTEENSDDKILIEIDRDEIKYNP